MAASSVPNGFTLPMIVANNNQTPDCHGHHPEG
jgi:hypothetical protein